MKINLNSFVTSSLVLAIWFLSCKKFVEVSPPKNQIVTPEVFSDSANATAAVLGIYVTLMNAPTSLNLGNGAVTLYTGLTADELTTSGNDISEIDFYNNSISSANTNNKERLWKFAYQIIYKCNACIEGVTTSATLSPSVKRQLLGEVKFIRAFIYFHLVNLYGDVPLVTSTDYHVNATLPRALKNSVYQMITADLSEAEQALSVTYISPGRIRPNRQAATALLARVYLYQGQWTGAENAATQIMNSATYSLATDLNNTFLAASNEAIWQLPPLQTGYATAEGGRFIPGAAVTPSNPISSYLLNAFEAGDNRKTKWLNSVTVGAQTFYYPFKYKLRVAGNPAENYMLLRLGEQYLIRAEARARQNNLGGAVSDLNVIRNRAGLPNTTAVTQSQILLEIEHERQVELFCESGHRWYDLKRTNRADAVLAIEKGSAWQTTDMLFPVPLSEMQLNPFLTQNPGY